MATKIEWCEETWNPITGCSPVSEGCEHCYARRMAQRLKGRYGYPQDDPFKVTPHLNKLYEPLHWHKPRHIFVVSMGDLFHSDVSDMVQGDILSVIEHCEWHRFLLLTKRPLEMQKVMKWAFADIIPDNIYLGVTAENQQRADERIPILLQIPAVKHFVSIEPMLNGIDVSPYLDPYRDCDSHTKNAILNGLLNEYQADSLRRPILDWVIVGGESGPGARPMHSDWVRSVRNQCQEARVPFFFKQWGEWLSSNQRGCFRTKMVPHLDMNSRGTEPLLMDESTLTLYRVGKKQAGRLLDGREWNEVPD